MNSNQRFQKIGKVKEAHGLKGELYVIVFSKDTSWSDDIEEVLLTSQKDETLNLKVERVKPHKDGIIIKLEGIIDRNKSESLKGWSFSIPEEDLVSEEGETIYLKEVLNFEVYLKDQFVGFIKSFSSNGIQDLLIIQHDDHTYEVPFVSDFILNIDFEAQKLFMNFPEDLMNLDKID